MEEDSPAVILRKKTLPLLRAVLAAKAKVGIPVHLLCHEYEETCMEPLKFKGMGYGSLEQFLLDIPEVCTVSRAPEGYLIARGIPSKEDAHIFRLVAGQKATKKKKSKIKGIYSHQVKMRAHHFNSGHYNKAMFNTRSNQPFNFKPPFQYSLNTSKPQVKPDMPPRFQKYSTRPRNELFKPNNSYSSSFKSQQTYQKPTPNDESFPLVKMSTPQDMVSLEHKLRAILVKRPNGLWGSRLQFEFKEIYREDVGAQFVSVIQKHFLHFVQVESPIPDREILYLKKDTPLTSLTSTSCTPISKSNNVATTTSTNSNNIVNNRGSLHSNSGTIKKDLTQSARTPKSFTIKPMTLPKPGDNVDVYISYAESLDRFYVQLSNTPIEDLDEAMQESFSECYSPLENPQFGQFCAACSNTEKMWFRARILSVKENNSSAKDNCVCHVLYIDYGNDEYVNQSQLGHLIDIFCNLPSQAIACYLDDVHIVESSVEVAVEHFKKVTLDLLLTMSVKNKKGSVLGVELFDEHGYSLTSELIKQGYIQPLPRSSPLDSISKSSSTEDLALSTLRLSPTPPESIIGQWIEVPSDVDYIDVCVSHVNSTADLYFIMIDHDHPEKLEQFENHLVKYFDSDIIPVSVMIEAGKHVAVRVNNTWYRAQVLAVTDSDCEVMLVDHGNKTLVSLKDVKDLPENLLLLPFQALHCSLHNVPETFDTEILQYLTNTTLGQVQIAFINERPRHNSKKFSIELQCATHGNIINKELISQINAAGNLNPTLPKIGETSQVYITYISDELDVYIQLFGPGLQCLELLTDDMKCHFSQKTRASEILSRPDVGTLCCAKFGDKTWYRAEVRQVMQHNRQVEVEFVDYGNRATIPMQQIRKPNVVSNKVYSLPHQAVKCKVVGLTDNNPENCAKIKMFIESEESPVFIETVTNDENGIPVVKILIIKDNSEQLVEFFEMYSSVRNDVNEHVKSEDTTDLPAVTHASSCAIPELVIKEKIFKGIVQDATSPWNFSVVPAEMWSTLESLHLKMLDYYHSDMNKQSCVFVPDDVCAVYHENHEIWYRAVIVKKHSNMEFAVKFPDFSTNLEMVAAKNVRELSDDFRKTPFLSVQCALSGVAPMNSDEILNDRVASQFHFKVINETFQVEIIEAANKNEPMKVMLHGVTAAGKHYIVNRLLLNDGLVKKL